MSDRERMILEHYDLVTRVAQKMRRRLPAQVELDELVSLGTQGLIKAVDRFDPVKGSFEAFAAQSIRGAILDGLRALDWAPRSLRRKAREIRQVVEILESQHDRTPSHEEIATELGVTATVVNSVLGEVSRTHALSLDEAPDFDLVNDYQASRYDLTSREVDGLATSSALAAMQQTILSRIHDLEPIEQLLLVLYYFEEKTLGQVSEVLGVPESRASQMHTRVVMELRRQMVETYAVV